MSMAVDFSDFEKGFKKVVKKCPEEGARGLFKAGAELLHDAIYIQPYAPKDIGDLRGSATIKTPDGKMHEINAENPPPSAPSMDINPQVKAIIMMPGFNIEYAARWHELTPEEDRGINWTLPGSGRKYLESKMVILKDKYMEIAAKAIQNLLNLRQ